jgi:bifunctional NMN adenylyltransferase/nudix hydrolase
MEKQFDTLVFIGRFQPFHNGHKAVIDKALQHAKEVVVVAGSSFAARSTKNPFTFEERKAMIDAVYGNQFNYAGAQGRVKTSRVKIVPVSDYPYDDNAWVSAVQSSVDKVRTGTKTGLIGHSKDSSSYYLKIFPQWRDHIEVENVDGINATDIRNKILDYKGTTTYLYQVMPKEAVKYLESLVYADEYGTMRNDFDELSIEYLQIKEYREKSQMKGFNFPSVFVTTDAVLTQSGYILLIKRGGFPFKDCWALPGGYLDKGQFVIDNMIKELREETCVKIPAKVLKGSIKDVQIFDHPDRDPRGRVITHGFHIDLGYPDEKLPRVKGADDAKEARWFHLSEVTSEMMAFDHYHIIKRFIPTY